MRGSGMRGYRQALWVGLILSFNAIAGSVTKSQHSPYTKTFKTEDAEYIWGRGLRFSV